MWASSVIVISLRMDHVQLERDLLEPFVRPNRTISKGGQEGDGLH